MAIKPLIGVSACIKERGFHACHASRDKSQAALYPTAFGLPVGAAARLRNDRVLRNVDHPSLAPQYHATLYQAPDDACRRSAALHGPR